MLYRKDEVREKEREHTNSSCSRSTTLPSSSSPFGSVLKTSAVVTSFSTLGFFEDLRSAVVNSSSSEATAGALRFWALLAVGLALVFEALFVALALGVFAEAVCVEAALVELNPFLMALYWPLLVSRGNCQ